MSEAPEPASSLHGVAGLDIRDYFAGRGTRRPGPPRSRGELSYGERRAEIADQAYGLADAMLKARGAK